MTEKVSIVTPVYNVEMWLEKCINSVINQTYSNFELILINDGSTDLSGDICDRYSKIDKRVKTIHQKNSGVSVARNIGIKASKGDYIYFLDSDDVLKDNALECLINIFKNKKVDLINFGYEYMSNGLKRMPCFKEGMINDVINIVNDYEKLNYNNEFCFSWRFIFKCEYINKIDNKFDEGLKIGEDTIFNIRAIFNSTSMYVLYKSLYEYNDLNSNSAMRMKYKKDFSKELNKNYKRKIRLFKELNIDNKKFIEDLYHYNIYSLLISSIKNILNGPNVDIYRDIKNLINNNMCIDSFKYFSFIDLYKISDNIVFFILLYMCKVRFTMGVYMYSKYFYRGNI